MALVSYLEILDGDRTGQRFRLREGLRIGRAKGEILLNDPKVSALHAQIERDDKGALILVDRDSNNGLRINNRRVKRVAMLHGVMFRVGKTLFKVTEVNEEGVTPEMLAPVEIENKNWKDALLEEIPKLATRNLSDVMHVEAFRPALQFDFEEGVQMEQVVILGYGPRRFGADVLDIELQEPLCPPLAFEVLCETGTALFRTSYPKLVLLNDSPTPQAHLREGDRIRIGQTLIRVSFAT